MLLLSVVSLLFALIVKGWNSRDGIQYLLNWRDLRRGYQVQVEVPAIVIGSKGLYLNFTTALRMGSNPSAMVEGYRAFGVLILGFGLGVASWKVGE